MPRPSLFAPLVSLLFKRPARTACPPATVTAPDTQREASPALPMVAWGAMVSESFKRKTIGIAQRLQMNPDHLMAIMAFETGRSFDPAVLNRAGSGATGLIQFMPATARAIGTTTADLARMTALEQLDHVEAYLAPYRGRMGDLASAYMAVLYPRAVGEAADHVLFRKGSRAYRQNSGLDRTGDGQITKADAAAGVEAVLLEGMQPGRIG